jgi:poly(A) polymerase
MTSVNVPRIIPRAAHPISRQQISPNALKVLYRLRGSGFIAWLVGGCVRDLLLGRQPKDFDIVTDATPGQVKRLFRNCRVIGRRFRLAHLHFGDELIEVATFRSQGLDEEDSHQLGEDERGRTPQHLKDDDGMVLRDNVFGSPEEDALRRDFTINALAYDINDFSIVDYVGGMEDLERRVVRTIGDPGRRFVEDPVRMIRAVRFAATLGLTFDPSVRQAMEEEAERITQAAPARLFEEIQKLFLLGAALPVCGQLHEVGLFSHLFPALATWMDGHAGNGRRLDVSLAWMDRLVAAGQRPSLPLFLALLFGDLLSDRSEAAMAAGASPQDAMDEAVADLLAETVERIRIPHRYAIMMREVLALQRRFTRMPGRNAIGVIRRPAFADALGYLAFRASRDEGLVPALQWWEGMSVGEQLAPPASEGGRQEGDGRGRRKRRRRRKGTGGGGAS